MKVRIVQSAVLLVVIMGLAAGAAMAVVTVRNIPPTTHDAPEGTSMESISRAIEQAAAEREWYLESKAPGSIVVSTTVRQKHLATVEIGFDEEKFWIDYRSSSNLDYTSSGLKAWTKDHKLVVTKGPRIHKNYNVWVQDLADHIAERTKKLVAEQRSQIPPPSPALIADELEKLDQLRARGVLSQEEFDTQKAKLLAR